MPTADVEAIKKELADINAFVRERFDPVKRDVDLLEEETARLGGQVAQLQERERDTRRKALAAHTEEHGTPMVAEGTYTGMGVLDLGLLRRLARSQGRESFGPAWVERVEEAKRSLVAGMTPESIQESHELEARRLGEWYTVDRRPTGQYESFSRSMLQSMTRAAMDSTTAGSGDELVSTLEARELWMDVNLQTLVAPLITSVSMPSNPFDLPRQLGDVNFYPGTENVATTSTAPPSARVERRPVPPSAS